MHFKEISVQKEYFFSVDCNLEADHNVMYPTLNIEPIGMRCLACNQLDKWQHKFKPT